MKKHFTYNFVKKTIVGSKASIQRANKGLNPEFEELCQMLAAQPTFTVKQKPIKKNETKKTYHKLTFDRMKEYIQLMPNSEERMQEYEKQKAIAAAKGAKYPLTKKWFLATYPEYKENSIDTDPVVDEESDEAA